MRQPSRRTFLGTMAALSLGVTGCLDRGATGTAPARTTARTASDTTETPTPTTAASTPASLGTEQSVGGTRVAVSNLTVRDSVLYYDTSDSMAVATRDDERYVLVSVAGSDSGPPPTAFSLVVDGERYRRTVEGLGATSGLPERGPVYDPSDGTGEGWVAFLVPPTLDATDARVVVEHEGATAAWRLGGRTLDALRRAKARFEFRRVDLPTRLTRGGRVEVRVSAENVGDVSGVFRGVLNVAGLGAAYVPYAFECEAVPGETVGWKKTFDERPPAGADSVGFFLYTVAGDRERRVPVDVGTAVGTATATENGNESQSESESQSETGATGAYST